MVKTVLMVQMGVMYVKPIAIPYPPFLPHLIILLLLLILFACNTFSYASSYILYNITVCVDEILLLLFHHIRVPQVIPVCQVDLVLMESLVWWASPKDPR